MMAINPVPDKIISLSNAYIDGTVTTLAVFGYGPIIEINPIAREIFKRPDNYDLLFGYWPDRKNITNSIRLFCCKIGRVWPFLWRVYVEEI